MPPCGATFDENTVPAWIRGNFREGLERGTSPPSRCAPRLQRRGFSTVPDPRIHSFPKQFPQLQVRQILALGRKAAFLIFLLCAFSGGIPARLADFRGAFLYAISYETVAPPQQKLRNTDQSNSADEKAARDWYNSGVTLMQKNQNQEAAESFEAALVFKPDFAEAHYALGLLSLRRDDRKRAKSEFQKVLQLDPAFLDAYNNLGALLAKEGALQDATLQFLNVLRRDASHVQARANLALVLAKQKDFRGAISLLRDGIRLDPGRADLYVLLGEQMNESEQFNDALDSFRKALEINSSIAGAHRGIGVALLAQERSAAAVVEFKAELTNDPLDSYTWYWLGKISGQEGKDAEAVACLERAVRRSPTDALAWVELGRSYQRLQRLPDAERSFRAALSINPDLIEALYGLANLLRSRGKDEEAKSHLDRVQNLRRAASESGRAPSLNAQGLELLNQGKPAEAVPKFREALEVNPNLPAAAHNLALSLARVGRTGEAIEAFRMATRLQPTFAAAYEGLGQLLKQAGDPAAEEELRKAKLLNEMLPQVTP